VRQTNRLLKQEFLNIRATSEETPTTSIITNHRMHLNYKFDWSNVEVLDVRDFIINDVFPRCFILSAKEMVSTYRQILSV